MFTVYTNYPPDMVKTEHSKFESQGNRSQRSGGRLTPLGIQKTLLQRDVSIVSITEFARIFRLSKRATYRHLSEAIASDVLKRIKKGFYYLDARPPMAFEIANVIYRPSYISLETALSFYRLIPETVYVITSITTKHSKRFVTLNQEFAYSKIKKQLFFGYKNMNMGGKRFLIAEKEKAFLDYIYFIVRGLKRLNERLDLHSLDKEKIRGYLPHFEEALKGRKSVAFKKLIAELI